TDRIEKVWLATHADGHLEAFGKAPVTNDLLHSAQLVPNGGWDGTWAPFFQSGHTVLKLAFAHNSNGGIEVFRISTDNRVWNTSQPRANGDWTKTWQELYSSTDRRISVAAERNEDGRVEVFSVDTNHRIWRTLQNPDGSWDKNWQEVYGSADQLTDVWL